MIPNETNVAQLFDVSLHYGKTCAVDNVSLDIPAKRMVGLIGLTVSGSPASWH